MMRVGPWLKIRGLFLALCLPIAGAGAAHAQSASSFQMSCDHIGVAGATLFANCRRINGSFNRTSILLPGVQNINGNLRFNGMDQPSTFQNSCAGIGIAGSTLFAHCRRIDGSFNRASILVPGIANIDGVLRYQ
jgi:hypothetical protein